MAHLTVIATVAYELPDAEVEAFKAGATKVATNKALIEHMVHGDRLANGHHGAPAKVLSASVAFK